MSSWWLFCWCFWFGEETYWHLISWCWLLAFYFFFPSSFGFVQHSREFSILIHFLFRPRNDPFSFSPWGEQKIRHCLLKARWLVYVMMHVVYFTYIFMFSLHLYFLPLQLETQLLLSLVWWCRGMVCEMELDDVGGIVKKTKEESLTAWTRRTMLWKALELMDMALCRLLVLFL